MRTTTIKVITLNKAAEYIGLSAKTLRNRIHEGRYPSTLFKKVNGTWMLDIEEWNQWHKNQ
ncbi:transcriptional regulator [Vibrio sp. qd031]|uniref:helix-turn-helix transcriptional regulator n=1 Tax=Vibrio sp. qd031 TaxID=1603038 RepID=UPI000A11BDD9|nr:hypothetical protein [Vibrio sp. qd031]ORT50944.1 transcriptional regulator [Vibrio sp. qd031]